MLTWKLIYHLLFYGYIKVIVMVKQTPEIKKPHGEPQVMSNLINSIKDTTTHHPVLFRDRKPLFFDHLKKSLSPCYVGHNFKYVTLNINEYFFAAGD